jgi:hypothetical protein
MDKDLLLSIGRPQKLCMNCNAPLEKVERHPSVLKSLKTKNIERLDYCPECWRQMKDDAYESFWITKRVIKQRVRKLTRKERNTAMRALFESLWERRENEDVGPHVYFLAHLLMKWGGLKWKDSRLDEAGRELIAFEDPATGDRLEVVGVEMDDERMDTVKNEIEEFLKQYASEDQVTL